MRIINRVAWIFQTLQVPRRLFLEMRLHHFPVSAISASAFATFAPDRFPLYNPIKSSENPEAGADAARPIRRYLYDSTTR